MKTTHSPFLTLEDLNKFRVHKDSHQVIYRVPFCEGRVSTSRKNNDLLKIFKEVNVEITIDEPHIQNVTCIKS